MEELSQWLKTQHKGLLTYERFHQRILDIGAERREQYALYYLLAVLVDRFVEAYEETPLTVDVADEAYRRLVVLSEKAVMFDSMKCDEQLIFLNEIAASHLDWRLS